MVDKKEMSMTWRFKLVITKPRVVSIVDDPFSIHVKGGYKIKEELKEGKNLKEGKKLKEEDPNERGRTDRRSSECISVKVQT